MVDINLVSNQPFYYGVCRFFFNLQWITRAVSSSGKYRQPTSDDASLRHWRLNELLLQQTKREKYHYFPLSEMNNQSFKAGAFTHPQAMTLNAIKLHY